MPSQKKNQALFGALEKQKKKFPPLSHKSLIFSQLVCSNWDSNKAHELY